MDSQATSTRPATGTGFAAVRRIMLAGLGAVALAGLAGLAVRKGWLPSGRKGLPEGEFALAPVEGLRGRNGLPLPGVTRRDFTGQVSVVNVWASWCPYCRGEHAALMGFARTARVRLVGVTFKDQPDAIRTYLLGAGVPYDALGHDAEGVLARALGVRAVPTTVVLDRRGEVVRSFLGGMTPERIAGEVQPAIDEALIRGQG